MTTRMAWDTDPVTAGSAIEVDYAIFLPGGASVGCKRVRNRSDRTESFYQQLPGGSWELCERDALPPQLRPPTLDEM